MKSKLVAALTGFSILMGAAVTAPADESPASDPGLIFKQPTVASLELYYKKSAKPDLAKLSSALAAKEIYWFGFPDFDFGGGFSQCSDQFCKITQVALFNGSVKKEELLAELKAFGIQAHHIVTNETGTFSGISADITMKSGTSYSCEPKVLEPLAHWTDSITRLRVEGAKLQSMTEPQKKSWLESNVVCAGPIDSELVKIQIQIDLTNAAVCPLSGDSIEWCFIGRGIEAQRIYSAPSR
ncbi:MAG: hypothetical protein V4692_10545 [Bdellovibrionota bacterium]